MNKIAVAAAVALLFAGYAGFSIHHRSSGETTEPKNEALAGRDAAIKRAKLTLAAKHNAVTAWTDDLNGRETKWDDLSNSYSLQVENALTRHTDRPVLITGILYDILKRNGKYYMVFSGTDAGFGARLELESTPGRIEGILKEQREFKEYALIAAVVAAERPRIKISGSEDDRVNGVEVATESDIFIITGKLVDLLCLDDITRI